MKTLQIKFLPLLIILAGVAIGALSYYLFVEVFIPNMM